MSINSKNKRNDFAFLDLNGHLHTDCLREWPTQSVYVCVELIYTCGNIGVILQHCFSLDLNKDFTNNVSNPDLVIWGFPRMCRLILF